MDISIIIGQVVAYINRLDRIPIPFQQPLKISDEFGKKGFIYMLKTASIVALS
jgi:hypothetical protein